MRRRTERAERRETTNWHFRLRFSSQDETVAGRMRNWCLLVLLMALRIDGLQNSDIDTVRESSHCYFTTLQLTCPSELSRIAVLSADYQSPVNACACPADLMEMRAGEPLLTVSVLAPVNTRCSGRSNCTFNLRKDYPISSSWQPGKVYIKYICVQPERVVRYCNQINVGEGFLSNPGYPNYYQGNADCNWTIRAPSHDQRIIVTILDLSIRGVVHGERRCTDILQVREQNKLLYEQCGEENSSVVVMSEGQEINITLRTNTNTLLYPQRGVFIHYKNIGCPTITNPHDGYLVFRNNSYAEYMCCVGHLFPDDLERTRLLYCRNGNTWNNSVPDCVAVEVLRTTGNETIVDLLDWKYGNETAAANVLRQSSYYIDVVLPSAIIVILLATNTAILWLIYYYRRRKCHTSNGTINHSTEVPVMKTNGVEHMADCYC